MQQSKRYAPKVCSKQLSCIVQKTVMHNQKIVMQDRNKKNFVSFAMSATRAWWKQQPQMLTCGLSEEPQEHGGKIASVLLSRDTVSRQKTKATAEPQTEIGLAAGGLAVLR